MFQILSAHEVDSDAERPRYPDLLQEFFQWKPKPKGKKQKSQIDDTRTEISYSASTAGGDADLETSTYFSKDLATPSTRSVESKRSKKRGKRSLKETSDSVYSAASASPETPEPSKDIPVASSPLVTLNCPLCYDPDCILNKAAQCPLLRHNEPFCTNDCCVFCGVNCRCEENKAKSLPVSGLVARDENGVAVTLLKANGGPIEDSFEWAYRRRWVVPSHVRWEHKVNEWITVPLLETSKADEAEHHKKSPKSKNKRKCKGQSSAVALAPEQTSASEEPRVEEEEPEVKLILEGKGFKIFQKGEEKMLINYERKNCKYIGCSCPPTDPTDCGCGELHAGGDKTTVKHRKKGQNRRNVSLVKETSQGVVLIQRELEEKYAKEKTKSGVSKSELPKDEASSLGEASNQKLKHRLPGEASNQKLKHRLPGEASNQKMKKGEADHKDHNKLSKERKVNLSGKDLRHKSRAHILEASLRDILDNESENEDDGSLTQNQPTGNLYTGIPCPVLDQPGAAYFGGNVGPCICTQGCPYPPQQ